MTPYSVLVGQGQNPRAQQGGVSVRPGLGLVSARTCLRILVGPQWSLAEQDTWTVMGCTQSLCCTVWDVAMHTDWCGVGWVSWEGSKLGQNAVIFSQPFMPHALCNSQWKELLWRAPPQPTAEVKCSDHTCAAGFTLKADANATSCLPAGCNDATCCDNQTAGVRQGCVWG